MEGTITLSVGWVIGLTIAMPVFAFASGLLISRDFAEHDDGRDNGNWQGIPGIALLSLVVVSLAVLLLHYSSFP